MGRIPCNHYLLHYPSRRGITDFRVIVDFHVIRVASGTLGLSVIQGVDLYSELFLQVTWVRNPFLLHIDDFGPKHQFL